MRASYLLVLLTFLAVPLVGAANNWPQEGFDETHQASVPGSQNSEFGPFVERWWNDVSISGRPGSPAVYNDVVYFGDNAGSVHAFDRESGGLIWTTEIAASVQIPGAPAISDDAVYIVTNNGQIHALDRRTGAKLWTTPINAGGTVLGSVFYYGSQNLLIVGAGGTVKAYFADSQQLKWSFNTVGTFHDQACPSGTVQGTPVIVRDLVLFGSTNKCFYAIKNTATGTIAATADEMIWIFEAEDSIRTTPWVDRRVHTQERVMFGDASGNIYALAVHQNKDAHATWQYREPFVSGKSSEFKASGAVQGEYTYVASRNGNVIQIHMPGGTKGWVTSLGQEIVGTPAIANGKIIIGTMERNLYMLNTADGQLVDQRAVNSPIHVHPVITGSQAVWASNDGGLHSYGGQKPQRADLSVESLSVGGLSQGTPATLTATVKNVGSLASPATTAAFSVDDQPIAEGPVAALQPGNQTSVSVSYTPSKTGSVVIDVLVDPSHTIQESDRANNLREQITTIGAAPPPANGGGGNIPPADDEEAPGAGAFLVLLAALAAAGLAARSRRRD